MHIALQGCLKGKDVSYGLTPDTGGHIKYLLELVAAARKAGVRRQSLVTRLFDDPVLGPEYAIANEIVSEGVQIVRIEGGHRRYLAKEALHTELPALADALEAHILSLDTKPDVLHGHYADGGWLAAEMKARLDIPVFFTGHSLGLMKRETSPHLANCPSLTRRIEIESRAIADADLIIASSLDEAEIQYAGYEGASPERIAINPPGCDLSAFSCNADTLIDPLLVDGINRFLSDPSRPPILALARPVRKKNLTGLLRAYGEDKGLQRRANLVIFAGTRDDIRSEDTETAEVMAELFYLVDRYDLWGKVALPKNHTGAQVPDIYRFAAERGGVFVNTALNEPFGLTFLEAAASGLPVVATNSGGPNDIIGTCRNGRLVNPRSPIQTADAIIELLDDDALWETCARNGREGMVHYSWERHAKDYVADIRLRTAKPAKPALHLVRRPYLIVSDIDDTLIGERDSLAAFAEWRGRNPGFHFAVATGRSLHSALRALREWSAPTPDILITSVGSEIYYAHDRDLRLLRGEPRWADRIAERWQPGKIVSFLDDHFSLRAQHRREQRRFKRSWFADSDAAAHEIRLALAHQELAASVIFSHGQYLDILPEKATKGDAMHFVARKLGVAETHTIAAGDSGNDLDLLKAAASAVVVGNHTPELEVMRAASNTFFSAKPYAGGILDGLARLGHAS